MHQYATYRFTHNLTEQPYIILIATVRDFRRIVQHEHEQGLARVVKVFGTAQPHHAYLFANRRANRLKILVHDGIGVWLAARRLHQGGFTWPRSGKADQRLTQEQLQALVIGLTWHRIGPAGVIDLL